MITVSKLGIAITHNAPALRSMSVWVLLAFIIIMVVLLSVLPGDHGTTITALCGLVTALGTRLISVTATAPEVPSDTPFPPT